jgi:hypothetical protein
MTLLGGSGWVVFVVFELVDPCLELREPLGDVVAFLLFE